ncbi:uncharacterized protein CG13380 [Drosophila rhopaloa]|uniref:Uncharacterized protein CG13380 n=1 Tax=Drosophila rhopaloa TaxID=1041015 RepID=A0A6P4EF26_DRORH|nr:uncharacterized protein CG13380 [Drosophila rhopaloa]
MTSYRNLVNKGTDPDSIAARLRERYGNLTAPSVKQVTIIRKSISKSFHSLPLTDLEAEQQEYLEFEKDLNNIRDLNEKINVQIQSEGQPKLKYDLPEGYKSSRLCICMRPHTAYECDRCHQYIHGRIAEVCEKHPAEFFLMDLRSCPYCKAPVDMIKKAPISWEDIRKIEDADLPFDEDL